jgi:hypothetical protein
MNDLASGFNSVAKSEWTGDGGRSGRSERSVDGETAGRIEAIEGGMLSNLLAPFLSHLLFGSLETSIKRLSSELLIPPKEVAELPMCDFSG